MDLWGRKVLEKLPSDRVPNENSRCREPQQSAHGRSALTLPIVNNGFTLPFDMDITITYRGAPQPSPGARDYKTPMVVWPMPPMVQGEPPRDFEDDMRGFMEGEIPSMHCKFQEVSSGKGDNSCKYIYKQTN